MVFKKFIIRVAEIIGYVGSMILYCTIPIMTIIGILSQIFDDTKNYCPQETGIIIEKNYFSCGKYTMCYDIKVIDAESNVCSVHVSKWQYEYFNIGDVVKTMNK